MKLIQDDINWLDGHGFFAAKKYFKGEFRREIFLTIFDVKLNQSAFGFMFVCKQNVILVIKSNLTDRSGIYELESSDALSITENDIDLKKVLNSGGSVEYSFNISTTDPINFINLNNKYILLLNIQPELKYGAILKGAVATLYVTGKDYLDKTKNTLKLLLGATRGVNVSFDVPLHGISANVSKINIYVGIFLFITFVIIFVLFFILKILKI